MMRFILIVILFLIGWAKATTPAYYLHHERSTQATVEADCQNRELCLDRANLAPLGRFNDGTLWHGVTQEKPNVNLTGTLTVAGAATMSNNLTMSLLGINLPVFTNGSKQLTTNPITGSGNVVMSASPTGTGTWTLPRTVFTDSIIGGNARFTGYLSPLGILSTTLYGPQISGVTTSDNVINALAFYSTFEIGCTGTADVASLSSASMKTAGGLAVTKKLLVGGNTTLSGTADVTGTIGIGTTNASNTGLLVNNSALATSSQYGISSKSAFTSSAITDATAAYFKVNTAAASFTATKSCGLQIDTPFKGAGSAITTAYGLKIEDQTQGNTNYGIFTGLGTNVIGDRTKISDYSAIVGSNAGLDVRFQNLGSTSQYQLNQSGTFNSSATIQGIGINALLATAASSFTMTDGIGLHVETPSKGAGSTITNVYGLKIDNQTGGTNNWAIKTGIGLVDFGQNVLVAGTLGVTGATTLTGGLNLPLATASLPLFTDGSKNTVSNPVTGTGNVVMSTSPTITTPTISSPTITGAVSMSSTLGVTGATTLNSTLSITNNSNIPVSGSSTEISYNTGINTGIFTAYNRTGTAYRDVWLKGLNVQIQTNDVAAITVATNQAVTLSNTLAVTGATTLTGGLTSSVGGGYEEGTFTATITGCTTSPTATASWVRVGKMVTLILPALNATSNATTFTFTGLPASIQPVTAQFSFDLPLGITADNGGANPNAMVRVNASGTLTFYNAGSINGWTASGTKGLSGAIPFTYTLQ